MVVSDAMFSTEKGHFRQFCLITYSVYKMVTCATFESVEIFSDIWFYLNRFLIEQYKCGCLWFYGVICVTILPMLFRHVTRMIKNVMLDLPNVDNVSNASVSVAEASVSTPEDVCSRFERNLRITQNTLFA